MIHQQNRSTTTHLSFPQTQYEAIERTLRNVGKLIKYTRVLGLQLTVIERLSIDEAHNVAKLHGFTWDEIFMIEEEGAKAVRS